MTFYILTFACFHISCFYLMLLACSVVQGFLICGNFQPENCHSGAPLSGEFLHISNNANVF